MSAELRHIDFHGQQVPVLIQEDGEMLVPMRPRVDALGLDWSSQASKFRSNPRKWGVAMITTPTAGGMQQVLCLPLRKLDVWLLNLEPSRVKPEFREELEREQDNLSQVLWAYRLTGAALRPEVRAAAPEATRTLFSEIEALTGLNPETAQPGATPLKPWQVECEEARTLVLAHLEARVAEGLSMEKAIAELVEAAESDRLPARVMEAIRKANARAGEGERTISRRTLQRLLEKGRKGESLAPKASDRPAPEWLEDLLNEVESSPSLAEAHRRLLEQNPDGPSYDASRRALAKAQQSQTPAHPALTAPRLPSAALLAEIRQTYGPQAARVVLWQKFGFPDPRVLPGATETGKGVAR